MVHALFGEILAEFRCRLPDICHINSKGYGKAAAIVETRPCYFLPHVLTNASYFLQDEWNLYVFYSKSNEEFLRRTLKNWQINFIRIETARLTQDDYSRLLMSEQFWNCFREENILIFQSDTLFCRTVSDEYFRYDYIGAPCGPEMSILNGGFSLRHKTFMLNAIRRCKEILNDNVEDFFFTHAGRSLQACLPDLETACRFSVESIMMDIPVGVHGTDKYYLPQDAVEKLVHHFRKHFDSRSLGASRL